MKSSRFISTALAVVLVTGSKLAMASSLTLADDGVHVEGYDLSEYGIAAASWTNFENDVKVKITKQGKRGAKGSLLRVTGKNGGSHYFNLEPTDNFTLKGSRYKLKVRFDANAKLLNGKVRVKGTIRTEEGAVSGKLLTAMLGDQSGDRGYAFTNNLLGFNVFNLKCHTAIQSISPGGCGAGESAYVSLDRELGEITRNYRSSGLAVTGLAAIPVNSVPLPGAAWIFASGLIGLIGMARRRKQ